MNSPCKPCSSCEVEMNFLETQQAEQHEEKKKLTKEERGKGCKGRVTTFLMVGICAALLTAAGTFILESKNINEIVTTPQFEEESAVENVQSVQEFK